MGKAAWPRGVFAGLCVGGGPGRPGCRLSLAGRRRETSYSLSTRLWKATGGIRGVSGNPCGCSQGGEVPPYSVTGGPRRNQDANPSRELRSPSRGVSP